MSFLLLKYAITAGIIVLVSEVAKHADRLGALIASLPFVTILVMIWLHVENQPTETIANHAFYTFWYVFPTLPMFLLIPWLLRRDFGFWVSLSAGIATTLLCFLLAALVARRFGVSLLPES